MECGHKERDSECYPVLYSSKDVNGTVAIGTLAIKLASESSESSSGVCTRGDAIHLWIRKKLDWPVYNPS